jgi:ABC-type dipeptide/oligopeptide/nickel transport system ATPase component
MIKISNLHKIFSTEEVETTALNGIDMDVKEMVSSWLSWALPAAENPPS